MSWKLVALFVILCPLLGATLDAQEIQSNPLMKEYNQAWRLTGQQKYDDALVVLKEIIAKDKTFYRAYAGVAEAYNGKKDLAEAERYFHLLLEQDGQNGLCFYGLGKAYDARKDYHPAREQYKKCIELAPDWYGCYWAMVQSFLDEHNRGGVVNWVEAVDYFKKRGGEHPDNPALYLALGMSYQTQGHLLEALRVYEIGLEKATKNQDVELQYRLVWGLGWTNQGHDNTKSLERFEQALRLVEAMGDEAEKISTVMWIGAAHLSLGDHRQAVEHYQQARRLAREAGHKWWEASVMRDLGVFYAEHGNDRKKALEWYEQALRIFQEIGDLHWQVKLLESIAAAHREAGDDPRALEHLQRALKLAREGEEIGGKGRFSNPWQSSMACVGTSRRL
ncbi:MAG: tetratricopeptide repeat protein [Acidobacteria bacterium]|nr:tetratricopeptide repeat protein [Acidobacteriota bacterium]MBI3657718.1 tetratricopeptide repeat protein [Acidobacteriota bacterium]